MSDYIGIVVILLMGILIRVYYKNLFRMEKETLRLQENLNKAERFFDEVNEQIKGIRKYRHDLKKHIRIVEEFLRNSKSYQGYEEYHELLRLMSGMQKDIEQAQENRFSDHEVLNAICEIKQKECEEHGIDFFTDIDDADYSWIDDFHLTGILLNLLDNAQEVQNRVEEGKPRWVSLYVKEQNNTDLPGIEITIANPLPEKEIPDFQTKKKDKKHHGFGIDIAEEYAGIYHGKLDYQFRADQHILLVCTMLRHKSDE